MFEQLRGSAAPKDTGGLGRLLFTVCLMCAAARSPPGGRRVLQPSLALLTTGIRPLATCPLSVADRRLWRRTQTQGGSVGTPRLPGCTRVAGSPL